MALRFKKRFVAVIALIELEGCLGARRQRRRAREDQRKVLELVQSSRTIFDDDANQYEEAEGTKPAGRKKQTSCGYGDSHFSNWGTSLLVQEVNRGRE